MEEAERWRALFAGADAAQFSGCLIPTAGLRAQLVKDPPHLTIVEQDPSLGTGLPPELRDLGAATRWLMVIDACTREMLVECVRHGAAGYLLRAWDAPLRLRAMREVAAGETWFGREALLEALRGQIGGAGEPVPAPACDVQSLTKREEEILRLIGDGLSNKEIARRLAISDKTVKTHLHRVYVKLRRSGRYKAFLSQPRFAGALP